MKIRISGNSIRFRLRQSEVKRFSKDGTITEVISFGPLVSDKLGFILERAVSNEFSIKYDTHTVTIRIPQILSEKWAQTEMVGFDETIQTGKGEAVSVLVEKDFACLDGTDIENADAYPNPNAPC